MNTPQQGLRQLHNAQQGKRDGRRIEANNYLFGLIEKAGKIQQSK